VEDEEEVNVIEDDEHENAHMNPKPLQGKEYP
jgi:hypothetical protein